MARATFNSIVIAESSETIEIEGNQYFPPNSVNMQYLSETNKNTICPWKGTASYYTVTVDGKVAPDAAWTYRSPSDQATQIKDYIAFWRGVQVEK
jgi:uncharacterized protein (DUF427 family)